MATSEHVCAGPDERLTGRLVERPVRRCLQRRHIQSGAGQDALRAFQVVCFARMGRTGERQ